MRAINQKAQKIMDIITDGVDEENSHTKIDNNGPDSGCLPVVVEWVRDCKPPCCVNGVTPECDSCSGFDGNCVAYRAALKEMDTMEYRFRVAFAEGIAKAKKKG